MQQPSLTQNDEEVIHIVLYSTLSYSPSHFPLNRENFGITLLSELNARPSLLVMELALH
jgi:hypothetical protein